MKLFFIIISIASAVLLGSCKIFSVGSYPNAQLYDVKTSEDTLIEAIRKFKFDNPIYDVPKQLQLKDGRDTTNPNQLWYHVYFYFPTENQIIYTWTRPSNNGGTDFALVAINQGLRLSYCSPTKYLFLNHRVALAS